MHHNMDRINRCKWLEGFDQAKCLPKSLNWEWMQSVKGAKTIRVAIDS